MESVVLRDLKALRAYRVRVGMMGFRGLQEQGDLGLIGIDALLEPTAMCKTQEVNIVFQP